MGLLTDAHVWINNDFIAGGDVLVTSPDQVSASCGTHRVVRVVWYGREGRGRRGGGKEGGGMGGRTNATRSEQLVSLLPGRSYLGDWTDRWSAGYAAPPAPHRPYRDTHSPTVSLGRRARCGTSRACCSTTRRLRSETIGTVSLLSGRASRLPLARMTSLTPPPLSRQVRLPAPPRLCTHNSAAATAAATATVATAAVSLAT